MGVQDELISIRDLTDARKGLFAEHIVDQELRSSSHTELFGYLYWVRDKSHSLDSVTTFNAKPFLLLNIPYYHAAKLPEYVRTLCPSADNPTVR